MPHELMTSRAQQVLQQMLAAEARDDLDGAEIACDGGQCWLGLTRISRRTVDRLLALALLREDSFGGGCEHYTLNEEGRAMARDPSYTPLIDAELRKLAAARAHQ